MSIATLARRPGRGQRLLSLTTLDMVQAQNDLAAAVSAVAKGRQQVPIGTGCRRAAAGPLIARPKPIRVGMRRGVLTTRRTERTDGQMTAMRKLFLISIQLAGAALVTACTHVQPPIDDLLAQDRGRCVKVGAVPDTDAMRRCMVEFESARRHGTWASAWYATEEERLDDDRQTCAKIGFDQSSDALRDCVVELQAARLHRGRSGIR